ncbi:MAG: hypothetical protein L0221_15830 [Chloroflexi bacterium]|nr:hypothetical protein [Chloroflexota bacterium]
MAVAQAVGDATALYFRTMALFSEPIEFSDGEALRFRMWSQDGELVVERPPYEVTRS